MHDSICLYQFFCSAITVFQRHMLWFGWNFIIPALLLLVLLYVLICYLLLIDMCWGMLLCILWLLFVVVRVCPWLHRRVDKKDTRYFLRLGRPFAAQYAFAVMKTYFRHEYLLPSWSSGLHESQWRKVEKKVTFIGLMVPTGVHAFAIGQCIYSVLQS